MSVIYVILPLALLIAAAAVAAFIWAVRSGQMDDLETPALRMLHDEEETETRGEGEADERREGGTKGQA